ncbi:hypothetical protein, partial [Yoonia sp.]|uniref:hypothetical protein n=1 Tax=Yoonia sp. TaxID=2212373 RepID=UPI0039764BB2
AVGALAWPGWAAAPPVLVRSGEVDCLFGHPAPPAEFVPLRPGVARLDGHVLPVPAATAVEVGGLWTLAVPARAELQAFADEHLGRGLCKVRFPSLSKIVPCEFPFTSSAGWLTRARFQSSSFAKAATLSLP